MVKHTQTICRQTADELFELFNHFVWLAQKVLTETFSKVIWKNANAQRFYLCHQQEISQLTTCSKSTRETYVCISGSKKCSFFRKIWRALFSCYLSFEIRPFALLPQMREKAFAKSFSYYQLELPSND